MQWARCLVLLTDTHLACLQKRLCGDSLVLVREAFLVRRTQQIGPLIFTFLDVLAMGWVKKSEGLGSFKHAQPCISLPYVHMQLGLCACRAKEKPLRYAWES